MRPRTPGFARGGLWALSLLLLGLPLRAELLQCRGELKDGAGNALNGTFLLFFRIWDAGGAGSLLWEEGRYAAVQSGQFAASLGDRSPLPEGLSGKSFRFAVETPPGTGWTARVVESAVSGAVPAAAAAVPAAAAPAPTPAAAPVPAPVVVPAPVPAAVQAAPAAPPGGVAQPAAAAQAPGAPPAETVQRDLAKVKEEALKAKQEAEQAKRRIDQLEKAMHERAAQENAGPQETSEVGIHVVQPGDTLRSIAIKVYGEADRWTELYEANRDRLQRGGELTPGQKLVVPAIAR